MLAGNIFGLATTELDRSRADGDASFKTVLKPDGDNFRLDGSKFHCIGTFYAELVLVRAATPNGEGVSLIIPTSRDGVKRSDDRDGVGQRVTGSGTTNFHAVTVAAEHVVLAAVDALDRVASARERGNAFEELAQGAAAIAAKAKLITDEFALRATSALFDIGCLPTGTARLGRSRS